VERLCVMIHLPCSAYNHCFSGGYYVLHDGRPCAEYDKRKKDTQTTSFRVFAQTTQAVVPNLTLLCQLASRT